MAKKKKLSTEVEDNQKANSYNTRLESYRQSYTQRFFELEGRYPTQNDLPKSLGGTKD